MPDDRRVSIVLLDEEVAALEAAVRAGDYSSLSEAVRDAMRDWQLKRALEQSDVEQLRRLWNEGCASGPAQPLDLEDARREARPVKRVEIVRVVDGRRDLAGLA